MGEDNEIETIFWTGLGFHTEADGRQGKSEHC